MISNKFTIKDLEQLTGIKAHTIRIWEKRYGLLHPNRTDTNIRRYDVKALQRLLNVSHLLALGHKISKVAKLDELEISSLVSSSSSKDQFSKEIIDLKLSMLNFDVELFEHVYQKLISEKSFRKVFIEDLTPFLRSIGVEWQIDAITPAHEHFISNLIRQKLYANIESAQKIKKKKSDRVFVLFLPQGELHDVGLLYLYYEFLLEGEKAIFLGNEVPINCLGEFKTRYKSIDFVSCFTVNPPESEVLNYLQDIDEKILRKDIDHFHVFGLKTLNVSLPESMKGIKIYKSIEKISQSKI